MTFFLKIAKRLAESNGYVNIFCICAILFSLAVGLYFKFCTAIIDSPAEQFAEEILDAYGINIDFSSDKKDELDDDDRYDGSGD